MTAVTAPRVPTRGTGHAHRAQRPLPASPRVSPDAHTKRRDRSPCPHACPRTRTPSTETAPHVPTRSTGRAHRARSHPDGARSCVGLRCQRAGLVFNVPPTSLSARQGYDSNEKQTRKLKSRDLSFEIIPTCRARFLIIITTLV